MKDYVHAKGNESAFIAMAEKLGYSELVFITGTIPKTKSSVKISSLRVAKSNPAKDRTLIESKQIDVLFGLELDARKDPTHFRNSGMNHIIAKLMQQKSVSYGVDFSQVVHATPEKQAVLLGRIMQNIRMCKKYKTNIIIASFANTPFDMRDPKDLVSFAKTIGLNDYTP